MSKKRQQTEREQLTAVVYGDTFALYDEKSFDEFMAPLFARLKSNSISRNMFKGKRCLDAGCGGGRGSVLMALCGAREVVGLDFSARNIESCRWRAKQKGLTNLSFRQCTLMDIPFEDNEFDIVWCNGVLHHTSDPDRGLREIARVLKPGGHLWLYLYGSGGIYWRVIVWIRDLVDGVDVRECIRQLRLMDMPVRRIAEWIDDWFVPYLRRYTIADVESRLAELRFENASVLKRGVGYDTSHRRQRASKREVELMGEGDLRFWCRKAGASRGNRFRLPDSRGNGSRYEDGSRVTRFDGMLRGIGAAIGKLEKMSGWELNSYRILVSRSVHAKVRSLMEAEGAFDTDAMEAHLETLCELLSCFVP